MTIPPLPDAAREALTALERIENWLGYRAGLDWDDLSDEDRLQRMYETGANEMLDTIKPMARAAHATLTAALAAQEPVVGAIRVCPKRDTICPHGMACPYSIDQYSCRDELDLVDRDEATPPAPVGDVAELVGRLHDSVATDEYDHAKADVLFVEAATALTALSARVAELERRESDSAVMLVLGAQQTEQMYRRAKAAEAELARLRAGKGE